MPEAEREASTEGAVPEADPDQREVEKGRRHDAPDAATIAGGIYRALRKGLEDSGNEPGAADFYYGEMEMRRLARRGTKTGNRAQPRAESALLAAYWAVSGYGLRASRAIAAIVVLILVGVGGVLDGGGCRTRRGLHPSWRRWTSAQVRSSTRRAKRRRWPWWIPLLVRSSMCRCRRLRSTG